MYCPRCGNQPASDRVRFCPSCGFRLDGVVDLLVRDGVPTNPLAVSHTNILTGGGLSERRKGMRRGAKMLFTGLAMFLPILAFSIAVDSPGPMVLPATIFFAGVFWMLYYRLFGEERMYAPPAPPAQLQPAQFGPPPQQAYFPAQQSIPLYRSPVETSQEHSVAEHTTRSLGKQ